MEKVFDVTAISDCTLIFRGAVFKQGSPFHMNLTEKEFNSVKAFLTNIKCQEQNTESEKVPQQDEVKDTSNPSSEIIETTEIKPEEAKDDTTKRGGRKNQTKSKTTV